MNKNFKIKGVDLKTEMILGFTLIPFILIIGPILIQSYHKITGVEYRNIPFYVVLGGLSIGMTIGLLFIRVLGKKLNSTWNIELEDNNNIKITFKNKSWKFNLEDVSKFKIAGNNHFKYVSFWLPEKESIRMRIGKSDLTPFSDSADLLNIAILLKNIQPFFDKKYTRIDKTKKISPEGTVKLTYLKKYNNELISSR